MRHRYSKYLKEINLLGDVFFLNIAYLLVYFIDAEELKSIFQSRYFDLQVFFNIAWITSAYFLKIHDTNRTLSFEKIIRRLLNALSLYLILIFALLGLKSGLLDRWMVFQFYVATAISVTLFNLSMIIVLKFYRRIGYNYINVIIAGYGEITTDLRKYFVLHPEHGYKFFGYFDDSQTSSNILGKIKDIEKFVLKNNIDEIYCCLPFMNPLQVRQLINFGDDHFVKIRVIPDFRGFPYKGVEVNLYDFIPVLDFSPIPLNDQTNSLFKRLFDLIFSAIIIVGILSWLMPLIGLFIKMNSRGPVIFKQQRSGKNNQTFTCYKFRTMKVNADADEKQALRCDNRITKVGDFLRRTNLDEMPQFINVLKGEMSVVGPRPHMLKHTEAFSKTVNKFMIRHSIKPGITGLAQVRGYRGDTSTQLKLQNRIKLDRFYVANWSLLFDFKIILMTIGTMIRRDKNAY